MSTDDADELAPADALDDDALDPGALALAARQRSNYGITTRLRPPRPTRDPHVDDVVDETDPAALARRARRRRGW